MQRRSITNLSTLILLFSGLTSSHTALATMQVSNKTGGLIVTDSDDPENKYWMKINGQIKADATLFGGDTKDLNRTNSRNTYLPSGTNIRALELNFNGGLGHNLSYTFGLSTDARGLERLHQIEVDDAYIEYSDPKQNWRIKVGQVPMPYGFENSISSKWISFLERSMPTTDLSSSFRLGVMGNAWTDVFSAHLAITEPKFRAHRPLRLLPIEGENDKFGVASRFIYSPIHTSEGGYHKAYHLSISIRYQDAFKKDVFGRPFSDIRFVARPEARARNTPLVLDTGFFHGKYYMVYAGEAAVVQGPFTFQAEYGQAHVERNHLLGNPIFKGGYVQASYILTGESRVYNYPAGTLGRIIPKSPCGAWEIAIRRSYLNLNSREIVGGVGYNTGIALSWYADDSIRIYGNIIRSNLHLRGEPKRIVNIFGIRCQVVF